MGRRGLPIERLTASGIVTRGKAMINHITATPDAADCVITVYDGVNANGRPLGTFKALAAYSLPVSFPYPVHVEQGIYIEMCSNTESVSVVYKNYDKGEDLQ